MGDRGEQDPCSGSCSNPRLCNCSKPAHWASPGPQNEVARVETSFGGQDRPDFGTVRPRVQIPGPRPFLYSKPATVGLVRSRRGTDSAGSRYTSTSRDELDALGRGQTSLKSAVDSICRGQLYTVWSLIPRSRAMSSTRRPAATRS